MNFEEIVSCEHSETSETSFPNISTNFLYNSLSKLHIFLMFNNHTCLIGFFFDRFSDFPGCLATAGRRCSAMVKAQVKNKYNNFILFSSEK